MFCGSWDMSRKRADAARKGYSLIQGVGQARFLSENTRFCDEVICVCTFANYRCPSRSSYTF